MHGSAAALRNLPEELRALEAQRPELASWLRPLTTALTALAAEPWCSLTPVPLPVRDAAAPLLHGAILPVDPASARPLVGAVLADALGSAARDAATGIEPLELLEAAFAHDDAALAGWAAEAGLDGAALSAAAQLAALPLLQRCGRALEHLVTATWNEGYCPICGSWPSFLEVRGLERSRTLRCGRCGSAWSSEVLLCAFCGERDHHRLSSLVPEGTAGQTAWVETCSTCGAYLKALAVLRGAAPEALPLLDARSIELDLAASERGFHRPADPGFAIDCHLAAARARLA